MDIQSLLQPKFCSCGKTHNCDIGTVIIEKGAVKRIGSLCNNYEHVLLVADNNTYPLCGGSIKGQLGTKLENTLIYKRNGVLVPNEEAIAEMEQYITASTDLIIGIGSGVIQDLCKHVSFLHGLPYFIVATAPSMDGYASKGAAMIIGNMKVTYNANVPAAIIGDIDVLKTAPMELIQAGYGDILGKYSCLNDWKLSHVVNDEYFCQEIYDLTYEMLLKTRDLGPVLLKRDEDAIKTLTEALVGVGIAMAYAGNSRPASGSEHHLSHFFEVIGIMTGEPYLHHGTDVAFSAVYTQRMREKILNLPMPTKLCPFDQAFWESRIREIYGNAAEGVIALQNKLGWYLEDKLSVYQKKWNEIQNVLQEVPSSAQLEAYLNSIGLEMSLFTSTYDKSKINNALWIAKDLKDRYTVLWLHYQLFSERGSY